MQNCIYVEAIDYAMTISRPNAVTAGTTKWCVEGESKQTLVQTELISDVAYLQSNQIERWQDRKLISL